MIPGMACCRRDLLCLCCRHSRPASSPQQLKIEICFEPIIGLQVTNGMVLGKSKHQEGVAEKNLEGRRAGGSEFREWSPGSPQSNHSERCATDHPVNFCRNCR